MTGGIVLSLFSPGRGNGEFDDVTLMLMVMVGDISCSWRGDDHFVDEYL